MKLLIRFADITSSSQKSFGKSIFVSIFLSVCKNTPDFINGRIEYLPIHTNFTDTVVGAMIIKKGL